ncbi:MAG: ATP-binding cassette domain-containing protein [Actinomycetota bacterium]
MSDGSVVIEGLVKTFGDTRALDGVDMVAEAGSVLGLLGPNGAGKTTTVDILSTLSLPDEGRAVVAGHDVVADPEAVRSVIALTGQFAAVDDVLTGRENLVLFGRLRGLSRPEAIERAADLLRRFSLESAADARVATYSGGMRRRLDIASSLVVTPQVLFLDEPTTGLDPRSRAEVWAAVRELRDQGLTVILTTQYLEEADQLADDIVVIDRGRVVASGTPGELKQRLGRNACSVSLVDAALAEGVAARLERFGSTSIDEATGEITIAGAGAEALVAVVGFLSEEGIAVADIALRRPTLDDVFFELTEAST